MRLETIWAEHEASLAAFVRSRVTNVADADDVLQEVRIKIHRHLKDVKSNESMRGWLFQVTRRTIIDHYRRRRLPWGEPSPETIAREEEPEDERALLSEGILPFMRLLPEESRALLMAVDIEGRSQKEIAEELGVPYSTLKSRVQHSRSQLRAVFERCCRVSLDARGGVAEFEPRSAECKRC